MPTHLDEKMIPFKEKDWKNAKNKGTYRTAIQTNAAVMADLVDKLTNAETQIAVLLNHTHLDGKIVVPINPEG